MPVYILHVAGLLTCNVHVHISILARMLTCTVHVSSLVPGPHPPTEVETCVQNSSAADVPCMYMYVPQSPAENVSMVRDNNTCVTGIGN